MNDNEFVAEEATTRDAATNANLNLAYTSIKRHITDKGQTVLLLGPEISMGKNGESYKTFFKKIVKEMTIRNPACQTKYFESENLFSFADARDQMVVREKALEFYSDADYGDPVLLELISRIRFPLIINVCPDLALNNLFEVKGIPFKDAYFKIDVKSNKEEAVPKPARDNPVIYNIFGSIEDEQTLILQHGNLYALIESLLQSGSLPDEIENYVNRASSFIFLGFKFDSWYYQLICHKLKVKETNTDNVRAKLSAPECDGNVNGIVMRKHFNIGFTSQNPTQVIERIIDECKTIPGALRNQINAGKFSAFISYAWKGDEDNPPDVGWKRGAIADLIKAQFDGDDSTLIQMISDTRNLDYGDSIDSFMTRIGMGRTVIRVISDKYIKSSYCMIEALRIERYNDSKKRVFTIIFDDLQKKDKKIDIDHYKEFWKEKCFGVIKDEKTLNRGDYENFISIYRFIEDFFAKLPTTKNKFFKPSDVEDNGSGKGQIIGAKQKDFEVFIESLKEKMKEQ